jgi:hypothetical protein
MEYRKIAIVRIILALIIGGFFYTWYSLSLRDNEQDFIDNGPVLFSEEDYKIEEKEDGNYISIDKIGFTCKVPENWDIKKEKTAGINNQHYIALYSPEFEATTSNVIKNGCKIEITAGVEEKNNKTIKGYIEKIKENPDIEFEEISNLYKDYNFKLIKISNHEALSWMSPENNIVGQTIGLDIPIDDKKIIDNIISFPLQEKDKCLNIWEEFIQNIIIE